MLTYSLYTDITRLLFINHIQNSMLESLRDTRMNRTDGFLLLVGVGGQRLRQNKAQSCHLFKSYATLWYVLPS